MRVLIALQILLFRAILTLLLANGRTFKYCFNINEKISTEGIKIVQPPSIKIKKIINFLF